MRRGEERISLALAEAAKTFEVSIYTFSEYVLNAQLFRQEKEARLLPRLGCSRVWLMKANPIKGVVDHCESGHPLGGRS
jgi:hypothetical protein